MKVYIIGAGPGSAAYLTDYARELIVDAGVVLTTARLYEQLGDLNAHMVCTGVGELAEKVLALQNEQQTVCVLVSGDAGFYSASRKLYDALTGAGVAVECVSGISSLQYLANVLGASYDDAVTVSVHGRDNNVVPYVCYNHKVFALTGGATKAHDVINELNRAGLGGIIVHVGENLGAENERVITDTAANLAETVRFSDLTVLLIENANYVKAWEVLPDHAFVRGKTPMTKQAVRRQVLARLAISPYDTVLDVGAGTGSVSIEAARLANRGMVYALEKDAVALELIRTNRTKFGAYNITIMAACAPAGFVKLPQIDKAFIGGSGGNLSEIVTALLHNNPAINLVIAAVTVETFTAAVTVMEANALTYDIMCLNVTQAEAAGRYHLMKAQNPVYIISACGDLEWKQ